MLGASDFFSLCYLFLISNIKYKSKMTDQDHLDFENTIFKNRAEKYKGYYESLFESREFICIYCNEKISYKRKCLLDRHLKTRTHQKNYEDVHMKTKLSSNENLKHSNYEPKSNCSRCTDQNKFNDDLCDIFLGADIPMGESNSRFVKKISFYSYR